MSKKITFIFFSMIPNISNEQKCYFLLLFSVFSVLATVKFRPYVLRELNILELQSNLTALITIFSGLIFVIQGGKFLEICVFLMIVIMNSIFMVKWFLNVCDVIFYTYEKKIYKVCPWLFNNVYLLRQTISDTHASFNLPKLIFKFIQNFSKNKTAKINFAS